MVSVNPVYLVKLKVFLSIIFYQIAYLSTQEVSERCVHGKIISGDNFLYLYQSIELYISLLALKIIKCIFKQMDIQTHDLKKYISNKTR